MSLSYLEREFVRRLRHRRGTHYNRYLGPLGEKANQFAAAIRAITSSAEFAPAALRVLSAIVLGFWLVHLVKNYMS